MKTDNYLNFCLRQASLSPLHYRHGCIVVRGGRVIGQGYNDYRPGFDGGALKTGQLPSGSRDGPAIAELKQKSKRKSKSKPDTDPKPGKPFIHFKGMGGAHHANTPLSMHSEMMAVYSALAASSTLSFSALSCQKPCFKLPSGFERKARLRRKGLKAYVERVCAAALETEQRRGGGLQGQEWQVQPSASESGEGEGRGRGNVGREQCRERAAEESGELVSREELSVSPFWTTEGTAAVTACA